MRHPHRTGITLIVIVVAMMCALAVFSYYRSYVRPTPAPAPTGDTAVVEPISNDERVFYFPVTGEAYRKALSVFLAAHPELQCAYFGADDGWMESGSGPRLRIVGHTIVCSDTAVNAQDETVP